MRFVNMYFVGFMVFVLGVVLALWKVGILERVGPVWVAIGAVIVLGIGLMM
ncbi:MAG TPA: hypothetical protein VFO19_11525 [Vicinamibacterales bacterium]|nr:hypothetical protein [Vicinamibacterales bacterium]